MKKVSDEDRKLFEEDFKLARPIKAVAKPKAAKKKIAVARIPYRVPAADELPEHDPTAPSIPVSSTSAAPEITTPSAGIRSHPS